MIRVASLFGETVPATVAEGVVLLRAFADTAPLRAGIDRIAAAAPLRHLQTRGGPMSVAITNCGEWGWYSDPSGYRYVDRDPASGSPWPVMPTEFRQLAWCAAERAGHAQFTPDCCLVNRYAAGARMGAHRDLDEQDFGQPIVSVSIGCPATFLWYGARRSSTPHRIMLEDGDVLVWGGTARKGYHAVQRIASPPSAPGEASAPAAMTGSTDAPGANGAPGALRYNLTFRRAH